MEVSCNVIKDLLPLYAENVVSIESKKLLEEHLADCKECQIELQKMRQPVKLNVDNDIGDLSILKKTWNKEKIRITVITALCFTLFSACVVFFYFIELPVQYSDVDLITTEEPLYDINGFFIQVKGKGISIIKVEDDLFSKKKSTLHYRAIWTSPVRRIVSEQSQEIGVPEYWKDNTDFVSEIIIDFADETVIYRNGELVE